MISIRILGLDEGIHPITINTDSSELEGLAEEFFGDLVIDGELRYFNARHTLDINIACNAKLICDRSGKEYIEDIDTDLVLIFNANGDSIEFVDDGNYDPDSVKMIANKIEISKVVVDELTLSLPMKRISPEFRNKEFDDLYKEDLDSDEEQDSPWKDLKKINFN